MISLWYWQSNVTRDPPIIGSLRFDSCGKKQFHSTFIAGGSQSVSSTKVRRAS
jgi:hypothetical protein